MFANNYTGENRPKTSLLPTKGFKIPQGFVLALGYVRTHDRIVTNRGVIIVTPKSKYLGQSTDNFLVMRPTAKAMGA